MKTKTQKFAFKNFTLETVSDNDLGQLLDTVVTIYPKKNPAQCTYLTTIAGNTIDTFVAGLSQLIDEHQI